MIRISLEIAVLLALVAANAALAASEIALVSSRGARLRARADKGDEGAGAALRLVEAPEDFLSAVQVGITAVGILAGAWGGTAVGERIAAVLTAWMPSALAQAVGVTVAVALITYLWVVLGELVPKRLALGSPERIASLAAPPMHRLVRLTRPAVWLLTVSMEAVLRRLPFHRAAEPTVTEEEIRTLLAEATRAGILEVGEHDIIKRLLHLSDRTAGSLMTPRDRIVWLDLSRPPGEHLGALTSATRARFLACDGELDRVLGYVSAPDLLAQVLALGSARPGAILRRPHFVRPWDTAFRMLELFRNSRDHVAVVVGDGERVEGLVTLNDVLQGIVGDLRHPIPVERPGAVRRADGSWLVDGLVPFPEFLALVGRDASDEGDFDTLHSFVVARTDGAPAAARHFLWKGVRLEVVDMDGSRVDKVLVEEPGHPGPGVAPPGEPV